MRTTQVESVHTLRHKSVLRVGGRISITIDEFISKEIFCFSAYYTAQ